MAGLCYLCKSEESGPPGTIEFELEGMKFSIFKSGLECEGCVQSKMVGKLACYPNLISSLEDGTLEVNWALYKKVCGRRRSQFNEYEMVVILRGLGILKSSHAEAWNVSYNGMPRNPYINGFYYYFVREKDARDYARVFFPKRTQASVWES